ncbi:hypothetical protein M2302_001945 [Micromonospora sp. A200]|uniref:hypothetical protein n=1 Tax=Micromonospora sp. A200 TaxID=2940568 RepID=UPI002474A770|nr:hypothetical protein [Micromonospora sp. A200]MDH6461770.1 hypothetical protein [Micromonospora sp. A200]
MNVRLAARLRYILAESMAALPAQDRDQRIAYVRETGEHGIRVVEDDGLLRFTWGGQPLAVVDPAVFADDAYLQPLERDMVRQVPDDPGELSDD